MLFIFLLIFIFLLLYFPFLRFFLCHPFTFIVNGIKDFYKYFRYKRYNECNEFGLIRLNSAKTSQVFGCGKTLSLVRQAAFIYDKYNNKTVYDFDKKKWCTQHIHIISNIKLYNIPYIPWIGESQFTEIDKLGFEDQDVTIFLLDEVGTIFNSRNFKENISMEFLTRLLQSRKNKMCLYMTSQRFQFTDKILRQSCSVVTTCKKIWRVIQLCDYIAYDVENVTNLSLLKPVSVRYWFAKDKDYNSYDTNQLIERLVKDQQDGNFLGTSEILESYGQCNGDLAQVIYPSKKLKKILSKSS